MKVLEILNIYKQASGQEVNMDKSGIIFSNNTNDADKNIAKRLLGIHRSMKNDNYLGLPLLFGRGKAKDLRYIKDKRQARLQSWGGRLLS